MTNLEYKINVIPSLESIIEVYNSSGINRPIQDSERILKMFAHSNLVVSAWYNQNLVGVARALTDFNYCCYLSDIAVREEFKNKGIGSKLIKIIQDQIGEQTSLVLLSAPGAMDYYPKLGFEKVDNAFLVKRKK